METDKIMRQVCMGLVAAGGLMVAASSQAATVSNNGNSAVITIPVTISNPRPTCDLKLNGQTTVLDYQLGTMAPGTKMVHPVFTASVECAGSTPVKTAITAALASGGKLQSGNEDVRVDMAGAPGSADTPLLWLQTEAGGKIKLTGLESDAFCVKTDTTQAQPGECRLRPVTDIPSQSPQGNFSVSVTLTVVYPQ